ncbi:MAG: DUF4367 domain-containing protein [Scytolyngbya sp. HA4215-MV1]|jgi:hypothetical protein|nr:DUF4367 domain-containing protein [Scytolyngbya sp. HA4215-MV1]
MKRSLLVSSIMALSMLSTPFVATPVQAQESCGSITEVAADQELREIRVDKFGFLFKAPKNYRAIASGSGKTQYIRIFNPSLYEYAQCVEQKRIPFEGFLQTLLVTITPTNGNYQTATDFLNSNAPPSNIQKTLTVADQPAVLSVQDIAGLFSVAKVTFLSPDRQFAIEIEADYSNGNLDAYNPSQVHALQDFITVTDNFKFGARSAAAPQPRQTSASATQVAPTLQRLVPQIKVGLPPGMVMRLPTAIEGVAYDGRKFPIYGKILPRDDDQFTIQLVATPDCDVRVCQVGYIGVAPWKTDLSDGDKVESVNLTSTIRGKYSYRTFPGSASSPPVHSVVWEQGGFVYVVSSFMNKQKVLEIAKSMANGVVIQSQR